MKLPEEVFIAGVVATGDSIVIFLDGRFIFFCSWLDSTAKYAADYAHCCPTNSAHSFVPGPNSHGSRFSRDVDLGEVNLLLLTSRPAFANHTRFFVEMCRLRIYAVCSSLSVVLGEHGESQMINARDLRKGKLVMHEGDLYVVHEAPLRDQGERWNIHAGPSSRISSRGNMTDVRFRVDETGGSSLR